MSSCYLSSGDDNVYYNKHNMIVDVTKVINYNNLPLLVLCVFVSLIVLTLLTSVSSFEVVI